MYAATLLTGSILPEFAFDPGVENPIGLLGLQFAERSEPCGVIPGKFTTGGN
jgi:hypothetical protein